MYFLKKKSETFELKKKSETFEAFKKYKTMMEKMTGKNIRSMKSDKGGEYMSSEFNSYCENQRINRYLTESYTLQQNDIAKKNKIILDMVRSMIKTKKISRNYGPKLCHARCTYIIDVFKRFSRIESLKNSRVATSRMLHISRYSGA
jgi:hypothetical protein